MSIDFVTSFESADEFSRAYVDDLLDALDVAHS